MICGKLKCAIEQVTFAICKLGVPSGCLAPKFCTHSNVKQQQAALVNKVEACAPGGKNHRIFVSKWIGIQIPKLLQWKWMIQFWTMREIRLRWKATETCNFEIMEFQTITKNPFRLMNDGIFDQLGNPKNPLANSRDGIFLQRWEFVTKIGVHWHLEFSIAENSKNSRWTCNEWITTNKRISQNIRFLENAKFKKWRIPNSGNEIHTPESLKLCNFSRILRYRFKEWLQLEGSSTMVQGNGTNIQGLCHPLYHQKSLEPSNLSRFMGHRSKKRDSLG